MGYELLVIRGGRGQLDPNLEIDGGCCLAQHNGGVILPSRGIGLLKQSRSGIGRGYLGGIRRAGNEYARICPAEVDYDDNENFK